MTSSQAVYESQGSSDLVSEFNDILAQCRDSIADGSTKWSKRFDSVALLWNEDLSLVAGAFSARGGVDQEQARRGVPKLVTKFVRLSGHVPPPEALQVHMRGMLLFIERGSYLTLAADVLEPIGIQSSKQGIHGIDILVNRNAYKCIFETPNDAPLDFKITLDREFSQRFRTEFQNAVDLAPSLRALLDDVEKSLFLKTGRADKPNAPPEIQRLLEALVV